MKDLFKVEFVKDEPCCRLDGVLLTPEYWEELCGIGGELDLFKNGDVMHNNVYYSTDFQIDSILNNLGQWNKDPGEWDPIPSQGFGYSEHSYEERIGNKYLICKQNAEIKPISQFKIDYPNFKKDVYLKIVGSLDYYYDDLKFKYDL